MNKSPHSSRLAKLLLVVLSCTLSFSTFQAVSEDIDIFSVDVDETVNKPNVLIVLDNSSNWARQSQQWPGGLQQGQSEVRAIRDVILGTPSLSPGDPGYLPGLPDNSINVGILEYITGGSSGNTDSGMVRMHIQPMNASGKLTLKNHMDTIFANINDPDEKRSQGNPFGNLMWDVYNYMAGVAASQGGAGTVDAKSDDDGYATKHSLFRSPLTTADSCTRTVVIFIGNNVSNGPTGDSAANVTALQNLGGNTAQLPFANYDVRTVADTAFAGYSSGGACYASGAAGVSACTAAEANTTACTDAGFTSCFCRSAGAQACDTLKKFTISGQQVSTVSSTSSPTVTPGEAIPSIATQCVKASDPAPSPAPACPATTTSAPTPGPGANQTQTTTTSWSGCSWVGAANTCGGGNNRTTYTARGTRTVTTTTNTQTLGALAPVAPATVSSCRTSDTSCTAFDFPAACNTSGANGSYQNCQCTGAGDSAPCGAAANTFKYPVWGNLTATVEAVADGTFRPAPTASNSLYMADEWARFLREQGVPLPSGSSGKSQVTTYTIDVFNAQQNIDSSALLFNMAREGGGRYFQAKNENSIRDALLQIFSEVQAVNSAFSSASLPVNATNRAQNENQVFIGVFRPDREKKPRWFGNLKRYQVVQSGPVITLGDSNGNPAINPLTGFLADCAVSFWSTPSGNYWLDVITDNPGAVSKCGTVANSAHSDSPDGPFVEKGAVAEVLRKGNDPAATPDGNGNYVVNRLMKTRTAATAAGATLPNFSVTVLPDIDRDGDGDVDADDATLKTLAANFIRGEDRFNDDAFDLSSTTFTEPRSTIHGDVIHSRPQPVNYGGTTGVVIYYGANDGTYRAVKASTGQELWSFVAPEHFPKLQRYVENTPNIKYFGDLTGEFKDYFFDGSTGVFQNADSSKIWIFPTMRRGGRKLYAFDVTSTTAPMQPRYLWSKGCDDFGVCDTGFSSIGQTWAIPSPGRIAGYSSGTRPVVVVGGGYDPVCDDKLRVPTAADCATSNGKGVYVLDAENGTLLKHFDFSSITGSRGVAADVALIDTNSDGMADHAYAVDTGGSIYRMSFVDASGAPVSDTGWTATRVARTTGGGRKFLFTPALFQANSKVVYVAVGSGDREAPLITQYPFNDANGDGTGDGGVTNRFYLIKDDLTGSTAEINLDTVSASNMQDYTTEPAGCPGSHNPPTVVCPQPVLPGDPSDPVPTDPDSYANKPKGWFINLNVNGQGEQVVTSAVIVAGNVIFSTNRPTATSTTACANSLGEARGYFMNLFDASGAIGPPGSSTKRRSSTFVGGGLPPSPVVAVIPIGGKLTTIVIGAVQQDGSVSSYLDVQPPPIPVRATRTPVYWYKTGDTDN
jgi:Tfp pilus tip-associated adhesin PilY1